MDTDGTGVPELTETAAAPTEVAPESTLAYSAEPPLDYDDPDEYPTELIAPRSWSVAAGLAALVVVLGIVVAVLVWLVGQPAPDVTIALPTTTPSSVTVTQQSPFNPVPTTVVETQTVTATPEAIPTTAETVVATPNVPEVIETPAVDLPTYDRLFVQRLRGMGWSIWDEDILTQNAHYACGRLRAGAPVELVNQEYVAGTGTGMMSATQFTAAAMAVYPNCP